MWAQLSRKRKRRRRSKVQLLQTVKLWSLCLRLSLLQRIRLQLKEEQMLKLTNLGMTQQLWLSNSRPKGVKSQRRLLKYKYMLRLMHLLMEMIMNPTFRVRLLQTNERKRKRRRRQLMLWTRKLVSKSTLMTSDATHFFTFIITFN